MPRFLSSKKTPSICRRPRQPILCDVASKSLGRFSNLSARMLIAANIRSYDMPRVIVHKFSASTHSPPRVRHHPQAPTEEDETQEETAKPAYDAIARAPPRPLRPGFDTVLHPSSAMASPVVASASPLPLDEMSRVISCGLTFLSSTMTPLAGAS